MRKAEILIIVVSAALVAALVVLLRAGSIPLGVPGEWQWSRLPANAGSVDWVWGLAGVAAYAAFVWLGGRSLEAERITRGKEVAWVAGLVLAAAAVQGMVQSAAPEGYGLTKWVTLGMPGSSGYQTVARDQMRDTRRFLADYPEWIKRQDALHIGTHPPGLFLTARGLLSAMESNPGAARAVAGHLPGSVDVGFRQILGAMPTATRAALALTGALTLLAGSATVAPLYLLARPRLSAAQAWSAAALWPLAPSAILFQPTADTAFPLLSTTILALALRGGRWGPVAGVLLGLGMQLTLAFLPVGLLVALIVLSSPAATTRRRLGGVLLVGAGFLGFTLAAWALSGANPFVIWWWNQKNHARFYVEYPRSYVAWALVANPIELAVGLGLPAAVAVVAGLATRRAPRAAWLGLGVLALLDLSGRNLSEVGRLWLPLMPALLPAAGAVTGPRATAALAALMGVQALALEGIVQVVYPV